MLYFILFFSLFAHEDLDSTTCRYKNDEIKIEKQLNSTYAISAPGVPSPQYFKKPKTTDQYDKKLKQLFDTYTFKAKKFSLIVKRPETKGPIKSPIAIWNNKTFKCH